MNANPFSVMSRSALAPVSRPLLVAHRKCRTGWSGKCSWPSLQPGWPFYCGSESVSPRSDHDGHRWS